MSRLILLRHGESTWNVQGRLQGQTMHVPLTARGVQQARDAAAEVAARLGGVMPLVFSSDQRRAWQTAREVASATGATVHAEPLLREQYLGDLEGVLTSELTALPVPEGAEMSEISWSGGETIEELWWRCKRVLNRTIRRRSTSPVVLVSHGDTLRVLLSVLDGRGHREVEWTPIPNAAVIERDLP